LSSIVGIDRTIGVSQTKRSLVSVGQNVKQEKLWVFVEYDFPSFFSLLFATFTEFFLSRENLCPIGNVKFGTSMCAITWIAAITSASRPFFR